MFSGEQKRRENEFSRKRERLGQSIYKVSLRHIDVRRSVYRTLVLLRKRKNNFIPKKQKKKGKTLSGLILGPYYGPILTLF